MQVPKYPLVMVRDKLDDKLKCMSSDSAKPTVVEHDIPKGEITAPPAVYMLDIMDIPPAVASWSGCYSCKCSPSSR